MARKPRLDAPGALHHVIGRGIERCVIFRESVDYADFMSRLRLVLNEGKTALYAWVLIPSHFHLLMRTGIVPLASTMRRLMTGYAVSFNLRHKRHGHLFQNRYKSILCEEEPYFLELTRYIHLNPYRAGIVETLAQLNTYRWSGHAVLLGRYKESGQTTEAVLSRFGTNPNVAKAAYLEFIKEGVDRDTQPRLTGGGPLGSFAGWAEVKALKGRKEKVLSDPRILGDDQFVEQVLEETEARDKDTLRLNRGTFPLVQLCAHIAAVHKVGIGELTSGTRRGRVSKARRDIACLAVRKFGISGAQVARYLGVTTSCINRMVRNSE